MRSAFDAVLPLIQALPAGELRRINLDVQAAVATILGVLPRIRTFRAQIADELPKYDLKIFDALEERTLALAYAQGAYVAAKQAPLSMEELFSEAAKLREILLLDAAVLSSRGLVAAEAIAEIRNGTGARDTAFDLIALVNLYRTRWTPIGGKTSISLAELEKAEILSERLLNALGERGRKPVQRPAAIDQRLRAFALCVGAYNHARRAIEYLRFEQGDAADIAPSLYAGRSKPGGSPSADDDPLAPMDDAEGEDAGDGLEAPHEASFLLETGSAAEPSAPPAFGKAGTPASTKVGMPGSNPFTE